MDAKERDDLIALGWKDEGIGWYSAETEDIPLFRLYNPNALMAGAHHALRSMKMYKSDRNHQFTLSDFNKPVGVKMNPENRWVKKAATIPWWDSQLLGNKLPSL